MPDDGLMLLPNHITASLMRALMFIRHTPEARLLLRPPERERAPVWSTPNADYDVMHRSEKVGRIWRFIYAREQSVEPHRVGMAPWRFAVDRQRESAVPAKWKRRVHRRGQGCSAYVHAKLAAVDATLQANLDGSGDIHIWPRTGNSFPKTNVEDVPGPAESLIQPTSHVQPLSRAEAHPCELGGTLE